MESLWPPSPRAHPFHHPPHLMPDGVRKLGSAGTTCFFTHVQVVTTLMDPVAVESPERCWCPEPT